MSVIKQTGPPASQPLVAQDTQQHAASSAASPVARRCSEPSGKLHALGSHNCSTSANTNDHNMRAVTVAVALAGQYH